MVLAQIPTWVVGGLVAVFLLVSVVLILTVLIQRPMGGGLSGAFGSGAGSGQTAFGAKTGDVLTIVTIVVFSIWLLGAIGLNFATRPPEAPTEPQISSTDQPAEDVPAGTPETPAGVQGGERQPAETPGNVEPEGAGESPPAGEAGGDETGGEETDAGEDAPPPDDAGGGAGEDEGGDGGSR
jgi:preprotein translocase subunit SecG